MADKQLVFENAVRDLSGGQFFDLVLIDGGASYTAFVRDNPQPPTQPADVAQVTSAGGTPIIAPVGFGNVTGSGTTNMVPLWTNGPNSIIGDSIIIQGLSGAATVIGIHRAAPTAILHVDSEGQQPVAIGTTPGTTAPALFRIGKTATGGETTIATTGVGGGGSLVSLNTGDGGIASAALVSSTGGTAGAFGLATGVGGAASVAGTGTNSGGDGGPVNITLGNGGPANGNTSGTNTGGKGGSFNVTCGTGGSATVGSGNLVGGDGGSVNLTAGTGGAGATTPGAGGTITITAGKAGGATAAGGSINFRTSINNGAPANRLSLEGASGALSFVGPLTAPAAGADQTKLWTQDAAAGDNNLYAINEAGKNERLTGLMSRVNLQFDSTNQTPANVTGLTFNVEASKFYSFEATLFTTSDVAGGVKAAIGGTATATAIIYEVMITDAGLTTQGRQTALAGATGVTAVTAALIKIYGTIQVNQAGTLTVQLSRNAANGTTSALVGSYFNLLPQGS